MEGLVNVIDNIVNVIDNMCVGITLRTRDWTHSLFKAILKMSHVHKDWSTDTLVMVMLSFATRYEYLPDTIYAHAIDILLEEEMMNETRLNQTRTSRSFASSCAALEKHVATYADGSDLQAKGKVCLGIFAKILNK